MFCEKWLCRQESEEVFSGKVICVYRLQGGGFKVHCVEGRGDPDVAEIEEIESLFGQENIVAYFARFYRESDLVRKWLTGLPCLKSFESQWNDGMDTEYERWLSSLTNLEEMILRSPHSIMENGVRSWSRLRNLKRLELWEFGMDAETFFALGDIKSLEELIIDSPTWGCMLGKEVLSTFENLPHLKKLGIGWWGGRKIVPNGYIPPATVEEFIVNAESCETAFTTLFQKSLARQTGRRLQFNICH